MTGRTGRARSHPPVLTAAVSARRPVRRGLAAGILGLALPLLAQSPPAAVEGDVQRATRLWNRYVAADDPTTAASVAQELREVALGRGRAGLGELVGPMAVEAERRIARGDLAAGCDLHAFAADLTPDSPHPHLGLARCGFAGVPGTMAGVQHAGEGMSRAWDGFWAPFLLLWNLTSWVLAASPVLALVVGLLLFGRHAPRLRHDIAELVARMVPRTMSELVSWVLLLSPLLLGLGPIWAVVCWTGATVRYMTPSEMKVAAACLVGVLVASFGPGLVADAYLATEEPVFRALEAASGGRYGSSHVTVLEEALGAGSQGRDVGFTLALNLTALGEEAAALERYETLRGRFPDDAQVLNNLGNAYARRARYDDAISMYDAATALEPDYLLPRYNLRVSLGRIRDFDRARRVLEDMLALDSEAVRKIFERDMRLSPQGGVSVMLDQPLTSGAVWRRYLDVFRGRAGHPGESALTGVGLVALAAAAACLLGGAWRRFGSTPARPCTVCGAGYCDLCVPGTDAPGHCAACGDLFVRKMAVPAAERRLRLASVEAHQRRWRSWLPVLSFVLPGSLQILRGQTPKGALLMASWSLLAVGLYLGGRGLVSPTAPLAGPTRLVTVALVVGMVAVWLAANLRRSRPPAADEASAGA